TKVPPDPPPAAETATDQGGGLGSGDGTGTGPGSASDSGPCTENCGDAPAEISQCGNGAREAGETCDDGNQRGGDGCSSTCQREAPPVQTVGPSVMDAQWLSGERKIYPSDAVKTQMLRDDRRKSVGLLKVCVDQTGVVSSAGVAKSIGYPAYDDRLVAGALRWRFRPMMVNGRAAPFCGMVTFVYVMQ
ncbi:MAG: TonB family protein, partial [Kofleriaceae bacterium]